MLTVQVNSTGLEQTLADAGGAMGLLIRGGWRQAFGRLVTAWIMYRALRQFGRPAFESARKY